MVPHVGSTVVEQWPRLNNLIKISASLNRDIAKCVQMKFRKSSFFDHFICILVLVRTLM